MFRSPDEIRELADRTTTEYKARRIQLRAAADRLLAADPDSGYGWGYLGQALRDEGDTAGAQKALWRAIAELPTYVGPYFALSDLLAESGAEIANQLRAIALRHVSASETVPEEIQKSFADIGRDAARRPATYHSVAEALEGTLTEEWPEALIPLRTLAMIRQQAEDGVAEETLNEALAVLPACAPVFRAALRQWGDEDTESVSDRTAAVLVTLLSEVEGPQLIDELLDERIYFVTEFVWHAQWAIRRVGQRHPAAALERLRAAARPLDAVVRAMIAEQIYFLPPETAGREQALLELLDDFPCAARQDEDLGELLMTVSTLLAMLGDASASAEVLERHRPELSADVQSALDDLFATGGSYTPVLIGMDIDDLTLPQVCCGQALIDQDEEGEEEDDEFAEPAVADDLPGRNDPCWCGSGKKYKKCHLEEDEQQGRDASSISERARAFIANVMEVAVQKINLADYGAAERLFFDRETGLSQEDDRVEIFMQWLIADFRWPSTGRTTLEEYRRRRGRIPESERPVLEAFRGSRYGFWEVQRVERRMGIEVKDYFGEARMFVHDVSTSKTCAKGDCLIGYLYELDGKWEMFGDSFRTPRTLLPGIAEMVETGSREARQAPAEYVRSRSHEWHRVVTRLFDERRRGTRVVNTAGDPIEPSSAS